MHLDIWPTKHPGMYDRSGGRSIARRSPGHSTTSGRSSKGRPRGGGSAPEWAMNCTDTHPPNLHHQTLSSFRRLCQSPPWPHAFLAKRVTVRSPLFHEPTVPSHTGAEQIQTIANKPERPLEPPLEREAVGWRGFDLDGRTFTLGVGGAVFHQPNNFVLMDVVCSGVGARETSTQTPLAIASSVEGPSVSLNRPSSQSTCCAVTCKWM